MPATCGTGGYLWQLEPWMPGKADYRAHPSLEKLQAAVVALAEFHLAAATFPLPHAPLSPSPGIQARRRELCRWLAGDLAELSHAVAPDVCPELASQAARICSLVPVRARDVFARLERCAGHRVALQPCIRDIWHAHVLFDGSRVRGLVDFGSMRGRKRRCRPGPAPGQHGRRRRRTLATRPGSLSRTAAALGRRVGAGRRLRPQQRVDVRSSLGRLDLPRAPHFRQLRRHRAGGWMRFSTGWNVWLDARFPLANELAVA